MAGPVFPNSPPSFDIDSQIAYWRQLLTNYQQALANDSPLPQMDSNFDGQSVPRDQWRAETMKRIQECYEMLALLDLTEITTIQL